MLDWKPWTGTWPSNATAKRSRVSLKHCSPCWGWQAKPRFLGFPTPPQRRAARAAPRRIRPAAPYYHRGARACGEAGAFASRAQGADDRKAWHTTLFFSSSSIRGKISRSCASIASSTRSIRHVSFSSETIPGSTTSGHHPRPWPLPLRSPLMASLMPSASTAGSRSSNWRWMICRARPGVWPAGG